MSVRELKSDLLFPKQTLLLNVNRWGFGKAELQSGHKSSSSPWRQSLRLCPVLPARLPNTTSATEDLLCKAGVWKGNVCREQLRGQIGGGRMGPNPNLEERKGSQVSEPKGELCLPFSVPFGCVERTGERITRSGN